MLTNKLIFNMRLLCCMFFCASHLNGAAKDLDFSTDNPCNGYQQVYKINFDNAGNIEWIIEGGSIIKVGKGQDELTTEPGQLCDTYMGVKVYDNTPYLTQFVDWLVASNFTQLKFYGSSNMEATILNPFTGNQQYFIGNFNKTPNFGNHLREITVAWDPYYTGQRKITCKSSGLGFFGTGSGSVTKDINFPSPIPNFSLSATQTNLNCNQGVQISGAPWGGANYSWNTSGGVIQLEYWN